MNQLSNEAAERAVIGAVLLDAEKVANFAIDRKKILPSSFQSHEHSVIWKIITRMHAEKLPIDVLTVSDQLSKNGGL